MKKIDRFRFFFFFFAFTSSLSVLKKVGGLLFLRLCTGIKERREGAGREGME